MLSQGSVTVVVVVPVVRVKVVVPVEVTTLVEQTWQGSVTTVVDAGRVECGVIDESETEPPLLLDAVEIETVEPVA